MVGDSDFLFKAVIEKKLKVGWFKWKCLLQLP